MKKTLSMCVLALFLAGLCLTAGYGQTPKEILDKMIDAQGGKKALMALKDSTIIANVDLIQQNMSGSLTIYQKEPDKMRWDIEVAGMTFTQAFDGEKGWMINPSTGTAELMPEQETKSFRNQALGNDSLLNPEKFGITYAFKGKEKIQDKDYFVLEQSYADGQKVTMYVDPATYLAYKSKAKVTQMGMEVNSETILGDYRKEGDLIMAHSMTVFQNGAEYMRMAFSKVTFNTGLQDSLFKMSK